MAEGDPFDRVVAALQARGLVRRRLGDSVRAMCPAHLDGRPSLSVTRREDRVLMNCFARCRKGDILQALGLRMTDLFSGPRRPGEPAEIVASYDYCDRQGVRVAQKVRRVPKGFAWRQPDPSARSGWRWGLKGLTLGLYRLPELIDARVVFVVEGEKAAELLCSLGLTATCPPAGASSWKSEWSRDLSSAGCRELVILTDHDQAGERHAERVAATTHALQCNEPIAVKVVLLPNLAPGADVVDWLEAGHDLDDLLAVVATMPVWFPGAKERRRDKIRRDQARERMRTYRAKARGIVVPDLPKVAAGSDAEALSAVLTTLAAVGEPRSGRAIKAALAGSGHTRRAIERALALGVRTGDLVAPRGLRGADLYRRSATASGIQSVTKSGHSPNIHSVTKPGHSMSVPRNSAGAEPDSGGFSEEIAVSQCPVTPFAVTHRERSSFTLQERKDLPTHTGVTGSGALGVTASRVTGKCTDSCPRRDLNSDPQADVEVSWRVAAMLRQVTGAAALPLLQARPGAFAVNTCTSCGDALLEAPLLGSGRCRPCRVAASVVAATFLAQTPVSAAHATRIA